MSYNPVPGSRTSSPYMGGFRRTGGHSGIDFAAPAGSAARAVVPGTVISVAWGGAYGRLVKVRHVDGTIGYYAHLSDANVRVGQRVGRGSIIGRVGSTGNTTGPHLHFEVRRNGRPTDPSPWLGNSYRASATIGNQPFAPGEYGGVRLDAEQLRNAQTIMSVGAQMGATERDLIIGLMTAFQESRLRNLDYGDRDSLGLFQQRPSQGWGSPAQVTNPRYAARKFFENLLRLDDRTGMRLTEAAQAVQRSAFPEAYAKWEPLARALAGNPNANIISLQDQSFTTRGEVFRSPADVFAPLMFGKTGVPSADFGAIASSPDESPADSPAEGIASSVVPDEPDEELENMLSDVVAV